ncbi:MAG: aminotransferase class V-fold PLP-dependent enzyme [Cellulosilyticaceae bacterium]
MSYRRLFEGTESKVGVDGGKKISPILLDSGATTPAFKVIKEEMKEWLQYYGPIGRGTGQKGDWSSDAYEESKVKLLTFLGANKNPNYQVVYTKNTTEALNVLASTLLKSKEEKVLTTRMEHHANDLPWRRYGTVVYTEVDEWGRISVSDIRRLLESHNGSIKYVTITGASNVTGYINPIHEIAKIAHSYGAKIIVDAAQLIAHRAINVLGNSAEEKLDFLVFSGHKMYAPFGSGAIVGDFSGIGGIKPFIWGGGTVQEVSDHDYRLETLPYVLEGGTQNLIGVKSIEAACDMLTQIGFDTISAHEKKLKSYLVQELRQRKYVILYGDTTNIDDRLGIVTFNIKGQTYIDVAAVMAEKFGIATRCGKFCAHPYVDRLLELKKSPNVDVPSYYGEYGMIRVSLGLYNTEEDIQRFLSVIDYLYGQK